MRHNTPLRFRLNYIYTMFTKSAAIILGLLALFSFLGYLPPCKALVEDSSPELEDHQPSSTLQCKRKTFINDFWFIEHPLLFSQLTNLGPKCSGVQAEFAPGVDYLTCEEWNKEGRQCLMNYITTNCNETERSIIRDSWEFALDVAHMELVCPDANIRETYGELQTMSGRVAESRHLRFMNCVYYSTRSEVKRCYSEARNDNSELDTDFLWVKTVAECLRPSIIPRCGGRIASKRALILQIWDDLTTIASQGNVEFWRLESSDNDI